MGTRYCKLTNRRLALETWGHVDCIDLGNCSLNMDAGKALTTIFSHDGDGDRLVDENDSCPIDANQDQADANSDGEGDVCDSDSDGMFNNLASCPSDANPGQEDNNGFDDLPGTLGDACEAVEIEPLCSPARLSGGAVAVICL